MIKNRRNSQPETHSTSEFSLVAKNVKIKKIALLFVVSFAFRIFVLLALNDLHLLTPDGISYHNMAVNLVHGNGLSSNTTSPYHPTFFREPGYPLFLASGYKLWALCGGKLSLIDSNQTGIYDVKTKQVTNKFAEIRFIKFYQAFFDSLSVLFLFLILALVLPSHIAYVIAISYGIFWPVATHCNYILRESFQTLVLLMMNYFFVKGLLCNKKRHYIFFALLWAISNMTLQITLIPLAVFAFLFIWQYKKNISQAFYQTTFTFLVMMLFMAPWLLYVYSYYPDIRIVKTGGCSLTYEWREWESYQNKLIDMVAEKKQIMADDDLNKINSLIVITKNDFRNFTESFDKTFNGYFKSQIDSMRMLLCKFSPHGNYLQSTIPKLVSFGKHSLFYFWVKRKWDLNRPYHENLREKNILPVLVYFFSIIFGLISFVGFFIFHKKVFPILLVFSFFWILSYFIGSEYRRLLPAYPYVFTFGILGAIWLFDKLKYILIREKKD